MRNKLICGWWLFSSVAGIAVADSRLLAPLTDLNAHAPGRRASIADWDEFEWQRSQAISGIARRMVENNYCLSACPDWVREVNEYQREAPLAQFFTALDMHRLGWAWQDAFVKNAFARMTGTGVPSLIELLSQSTPANRPAGIIFWQRAQKAGMNRTSRHVGINPDLMEDGENLFLMVHELAHRVLRSLDADEKQFRTLHSKIEFHTEAHRKRGREFPKRFAAYVTEYVRLGLELQLLNEWRGWTTAFTIYLQVQKSEPAPGWSPPWKKIGWVEAILAQRQPGEDLKAFTFRYLDRRFTDPFDPARPFLDAELKLQRDGLREKIKRGQLDLRELEQIVNAG